MMEFLKSIPVEEDGKKSKYKPLGFFVDVQAEKIIRTDIIIAIKFFMQQSNLMITACFISEIKIV